jgi:hypothetical protein
MIQQLAKENLLECGVALRAQLGARVSEEIRQETVRQWSFMQPRRGELDLPQGAKVGCDLPKTQAGRR